MDRYSWTSTPAPVSSAFGFHVFPRRVSCFPFLKTSYKVPHATFDVRSKWPATRKPCRSAAETKSHVCCRTPFGQISPVPVRKCEWAFSKTIPKDSVRERSPVHLLRECALGNTASLSSRDCARQFFGDGRPHMLIAHCMCLSCLLQDALWMSLARPCS